jgi:adenine C2-methylase RlmN of 23S rRNA A2503 and tRNA A37
MSHQKSGFLQALLKLEDARLVEAVGIPVVDEGGINRLTVCVSSQVIFYMLQSPFPLAGGFLDG